MEVRVLDSNPLYMDKKFRLQFRFGSNYPIEPPEVVFLPTPTAKLTFASSARPNPMGSQYVAAASSSYANNHTSPVDAAAKKTPGSQSEASPQDTWDGVPIHPHIYSNGIICLDLLDKSAWSPVHNVESVCISLQSMLTSNNKNERPPNDMEFCRTNSLRPKDIRFLFHDDGV
jgi:ubiquitin-conjugating enzyme E2 W